MEARPNPVYFLVRREPTHFTCYARGIPVLQIPHLHLFRVVRFYPDQVDLTHRIARFQRNWRQRRQFRIWCAHPTRLFYREQMGAFPLYVSRMNP